jgi:hypothetical protein
MNYIMSCKRGYIRRKAYTRRDGTKVKSTCIKDLGKPGRTRKRDRVLPKLKPGELSKFGYETKKPSKDRRRALLRASKNPRTKKLSAKKMLANSRRLVVLKNYTKRSNPNAYKKYNADSNWLLKEYKKSKERKKE